MVPAPENQAGSGTRRIGLLVQEDNCASGHDARGRVLPPLVRYGKLLALPRAKARTCDRANGRLHKRTYLRVATRLPDEW